MISFSSCTPFESYYVGIAPDGYTEKARNRSDYGFPDSVSCSSRTVLPVPRVSLLDCHDIKDPDTRMLLVNAVKNGKTPSHMQAIHNIPFRKV